MDTPTCPQCNVPREPQALGCSACGTIFTPDDLKPRLHPLLERYAAPQPGLAPRPPLPWPAEPSVRQDVWSLGGLLVLRNGASLPDRCVVCNRSPKIRWRKTFYWAPPPTLDFFFLLLSPFLLIIYRISNPAVRGKADLSIPLCEEHNEKRKVQTRNTWLLALGGIALVFVSIMVMLNDARGIGLLLLGAGFLTLTATAALSNRANIFLPKKIDSAYVFLDKAGEDYLRSLPSAPVSIRLKR